MLDFRPQILAGSICVDTSRRKHKHKHRQAGKQAHKHKQADKQTSRQADKHKQAGRQTCILPSCEASADAVKQAGSSFYVYFACL